MIHTCLIQFSEQSKSINNEIVQKKKQNNENIYKQEDVKQMLKVFKTRNVLKNEQEMSEWKE